MSDTKFSLFLAAKKIDTRRLLAVSSTLESLTPADRAIRLAKRLARKAEGGAKTKDPRKPRSGRPVTPRALAAVLSGGERVSGPTKTRILRAVNAILTAKKQDAAQLRDLF